MLPTYLSRVSISQKYQTALDNGVISKGLRQEFQDNKMPLSQDAAISIKKTGGKWQITDADKSYAVMKEKDRLNVYGRRATKGDLFDRGNLFATIVLLIGMLGQYMGGHFSDRRRKTRLYLLFHVLSLPFLILVGLTPGMLVVFAAALFALFHFANQPVENGLVAHYTPPRLRSRGYGFKFLLTFGFGSFASGFSGYIAENFGFNAVFLALSGIMALILILIVIFNIIAKEPRVETPQ